MVKITRSTFLKGLGLGAFAPFLPVKALSSAPTPAPLSYSDRMNGYILDKHDLEAKFHAGLDDLYGVLLKEGTEVRINMVSNDHEKERIIQKFKSVGIEVKLTLDKWSTRDGKEYVSNKWIGTVKTSQVIPLDRCFNFGSGTVLTCYIEWNEDYDKNVQFNVDIKDVTFVEKS